MKIRIFAAIILGLSVGSANALSVSVGDTITASKDYGPITLSQTPPDNEIALSTDYAGGSVTQVGLPVSVDYDFAEVYEMDPDGSFSTLSAGVVIAGSNDITAAVLAILDGATNQVIKLIDVVIGGATTTLSYLTSPTEPNNFKIALLGDIDTVSNPQADYLLNVSAIPLPAAFWLFGTAVVGLIGLRRKGKIGTAVA